MATWSAPAGDVDTGSGWGGGQQSQHQGVSGRPVTHHDGVDDVTLVVPEGPHGFGPGHVGLCHHQLNVPKLQPSLVHLKGPAEGAGPAPPPLESVPPPVLTLTSSSSLSSSSHSGLTRGPGADSGTRMEGSAGTLNFSAAALCTCWDRSSICSTRRSGQPRPRHKPRPTKPRPRPAPQPTLASPKTT